MARGPDAPIVANATPWGRGAVAVVRLSGVSLRPLLLQFCRAKGGFPPARRARLTAFFDEDGLIDEGLLTFFPGPHSYTGEDVAELGCHGNPLIVERLLRAAQAAGARLAEPGEFTRRAVASGRLDLTRAEAVLQAIEASTPEGLVLAQAGLSGAVAELAEGLRAGLIDVCAELEARLDYPGEGLGFTEDAAVVTRLGALANEARQAADGFKAGRAAVEGADVALIGPVNAGKSSLFNALGGSVRALVSPEPGTTRDVVERRVSFEGVRVRLLDTAGLRDDPGPIEAEGLALGQALAGDADLLLVVIPAHTPDLAAEALARSKGRPRLLIGNHADRPGAVTRLDGEALWMTNARTGEGVEALRVAIPQALRGELPAGARALIASARQRDLLYAVSSSAAAAQEALASGLGPAVAAEELYEGLSSLDQLVGRDTREDALDRLFQRFCVGK
ncbi:tRNA modification GTPase [Myxococcota bacterium]|nr:tRNA modification GTPase [Myxococcota bacterium]